MSAPVPLHKMHGSPVRRATPTPALQRLTSEHAAMTVMLTVEQVAAMLNVSRMTVYRLIHSKELGSLQIGRSFRVPEKCLLDYVEANFSRGS